LKALANLRNFVFARKSPRPFDVYKCPAFIYSLGPVAVQSCSDFQKGKPVVSGGGCPLDNFKLHLIKKSCKKGQKGSANADLKQADSRQVWTDLSL